MRKLKKKESKFLEIELAIYRLFVVVTWETTKEEIVKFVKTNSPNLVITDEKWGKDFSEAADDRRTAGLTILLGDDNCDVLVWLRKRPKTAKDYGVLYHELHHATRSIVDSRNLSIEHESPAFIYEYLATKSNQFFWK